MSLHVAGRTTAATPDRIAAAADVVVGGQAAKTRVRRRSEHDWAGRARGEGR